MPYRTPEPKDLEYEEPWSEIHTYIDKEIYPFCKALHYLGYPVIMSCAGHPTRKRDYGRGEEPDPYGKTKRGRVDFEGEFLPEEKREVESLAKKFGLKVLRWIRWKENDQTILTFKAVGLSDSVIGNEAD